MIQEKLFKKLLAVVPDLEDLVDSDVQALKFKASGVMDFNVDFLGVYKEGYRLALSHYYKHESGDMVADPDMEVFIDFKRKMMTGLSFQNIYKYEHIDNVEDDKDKFNLMRSFDEFLLVWLDNVAATGYKRHEC